jgi:hypothetical protein
MEIISNTKIFFFCISRIEQGCSTRVSLRRLYTNHLGVYSHYSNCQSSWSKGISETKSKQQTPCSNCMHQPVMSLANACTSQAYACIFCMHCPMTSQADSCSYCMGSVVLILSWIYLNLQLLCQIVAVCCHNLRLLRN